MATEMDVAKIAEHLSSPFPAKDIEWRVGSTNADKTRGMVMAYIDNRAIQRRLDSVMSISGWRNEFKEITGGVLCGISLFINGEWVTKWDGANWTDFEAVKGGLSDSMKRAAYQWGIGRYLYDLPSQWVPVKTTGRTAVIDGDPPKLPDWALPVDERGKTEAIKDKPKPAAPAVSSSRTTGPTRPVTNVISWGDPGPHQAQLQELKTLVSQNGLSDDETLALVRTWLSSPTATKDEITPYNIGKFVEFARGRVPVKV